MKIFKFIIITFIGLIMVLSGLKQLLFIISAIFTKGEYYVGADISTLGFTFIGVMLIRFGFKTLRNKKVVPQKLKV